MGLFRRSDDEGLYQGDPQAIYQPSSAGSSVQPGPRTQPAPPLFDDPPRTRPGEIRADPPPAPPGTFAAPPPPEPGQAGRVARRAVLVLIAAGTVGGAVYGVDRVRQWVPEGADPDVDGPDGLPTRAPATTRRNTTGTGTRATVPTTTGRSGSPGTGATLTGRLGQAAVILHAGNRYRVTVANPRRQAGPIWGHSKQPQHGFLILDLSITRIDRAEARRQISWSDWTLRVGTLTVDGELGGGGWADTATATVRLDPGKTATGTLVFDAPAGAGALALGASGTPASARWSIPAVKSVEPPAAAAVGATVRSNVGGVPFTAELAKVTWFDRDQPTGGDRVVNGARVLLDVTLTWSPGSAGAKANPNGTWVDVVQWRFTPRTGRADALSGTTADGRTVGRALAVLPAPRQTAGLIAFDTAPAAGTLTLLDDSGLSVMSWRVPGP